jgi:hypothetical protein
MKSERVFQIIRAPLIGDFEDGSSKKRSRMETTMAGITVSIVAGADAAHSSVNATGSIQHVITDKEGKDLRHSGQCSEERGRQVFWKESQRCVSPQSYAVE